jgi:hypothetical protein
MMNLINMMNHDQSRFYHGHHSHQTNHGSDKGFPNMKEKIECQKAHKLKGYLCMSLEGQYFFRRYQQDGSFCDYDINHTDMEIQIVDTDAYIYKKDGECYIDHAPESLGLSNAVIEKKGVECNEKY